MEGILDFSRDLDLDLLDRVVDVFYGGKGNAQEVSWQSLPRRFS
jgi:hypothetical protein